MRILELRADGWIISYIVWSYSGKTHYIQYILRTYSCTHTVMIYREKFKFDNNKLMNYKHISHYTDFE